MCMQCVAQSLPYAAAAVGGLQAIRWDSRRRRAKQVSSEPSGTDGAPAERAPAGDPS